MEVKCAEMKVCEEEREKGVQVACAEVSDLKSRLENERKSGEESRVKEEEDRAEMERQKEEMAEVKRRVEEVVEGLGGNLMSAKSRLAEIEVVGKETERRFGEELAECKEREKGLRAQLTGMEERAERGVQVLKERERECDVWREEVEKSKIEAQQMVARIGKYEIDLETRRVELVKALEELAVARGEVEEVRQGKEEVEEKVVHARGRIEELERLRSSRKKYEEVVKKADGFRGEVEVFF